MRVHREECGCTYLLLGESSPLSDGEVIVVWGCGPGFKEPEVIRGRDLVMFNLALRFGAVNVGKVDYRKVGEFFRDLEIEPLGGKGEGSVDEFAEMEIGGIYGE